MMKNLRYIVFFSLVMLGLSSCKDEFLAITPKGVYSENTLLNKKGIDGFLTGAYASLDGSRDASTLGFSGSYNWIWGSILGGDAYKAGVSFTDQPDLNYVMQYATPTTNPQVLTRWNAIFDGIGRTNLVLQKLAAATDPALTADIRKQIEAEARFLRGFYHFEGKKTFGNIPFLDENITGYKVPNTDASGNYVNIWPQIEADLKFAYDNLTETKTGIGRANKWAAGAFLGKAYLYQKKYAEAKTVFDQVIANGKNPLGVKYALMPNFGDNFRLAKQGNAEVILEVQNVVGDGATNNYNGFFEMLLCYPNGIAGGTNSWFYRPSQNLVNAFRTDANGLPLPDTYNNTDVTSHESVGDNETFTPYQGNLDPRLDHTVGRRGIPFHDWGVVNGVAFTAPPGESITNGGPYAGKKHVFSREEFNSGKAVRSSWYIASSLKYQIMRYADMLLMAAECEIETGNLEKAREYINAVRARAANSPIKNASGTADAAHYLVKPYAAFSGPEAARKAVRFERRLELGMEGHRFFDLVRWGIADQVINQEYLPKESQRRVSALGGVKFTPNKSEYQPIPDYAITQSMVGGVPTLKQNPGY
ncbi:MAG: RagB/SusD family nutrient uptake outer membrane protein [Leadbetterella sp.]|nr:RagB/SusD family nutrient uptake outer membrane protein [Leadbetterella sp.]